jgi:hypothetical protein
MASSHGSIDEKLKEVKTGDLGGHELCRHGQFVRAILIKDYRLIDQATNT